LSGEAGQQPSSASTCRRTGRRSSSGATPAVTLHKHHQTAYTCEYRQHASCACMWLCWVMERTL
jgi:hypothetical protein